MSDTQAAIDKAYELWLRSRCTTAFTLIAVKQAELDHYLAINDQACVEEKKLDIKAAINNYRSLCREAAIEPYNVSEVL